MLRLAKSKLAAVAFLLAALAMIVSGGLTPSAAIAAQTAHIHISADPVSDKDNHDHVGSAGATLFGFALGQLDARMIAEDTNSSWTVGPCRMDMVIPREFGALQSIPKIDPPPPRTAIRFA